MDAISFRRLMGRFATGVAVVTVTSPDGTPAGMTVNSFSSVSLDPPLISICIDREAEMHATLTEAPGFAVNILGSDQESVSRRFAESRPDRFGDIGHYPGAGGHPILHGVLAHIECLRHGAIEAGDHTVFLGKVIAGEANDGDPLLFYQGQYLLDGS